MILDNLRDIFFERRVTSFSWSAYYFTALVSSRSLHLDTSGVVFRNDLGFSELPSIFLEFRRTREI